MKTTPLTEERIDELLEQLPRYARDRVRPEEFMDLLRMAKASLAPKPEMPVVGDEERALAIVARIQNIGNREDIREAHQKQLFEILDWVAEERRRSEGLKRELEFYATTEHWDGDRLNGELHDFGDVTVTDEVYGDKYKPSGKRARAALAALESGALGEMK